MAPWPISAGHHVATAPVDPCGCPMSSALLKVEAWPSAECYTSAGAVGIHRLECGTMIAIIRFNWSWRSFLRFYHNPQPSKWPKTTKIIKIQHPQDTTNFKLVKEFWNSPLVQKVTNLSIKLRPGWLRAGLQLWEPRSKDVEFGWSESFNCPTSARIQNVLLPGSISRKCKKHESLWG